jgi:hypothetical protein
MSWAEVFAINSDPRKPLNKANYDLFYELAKVINKGYGDKNSDVLIVPEAPQYISAGQYSNGAMTLAILPSTIREIYSGAFSNCQYLENIIIPDGVTFIGSTMFFGCTNLKILKLPKSISQIDEFAFQSSSLEHIFVPWSEGDVPLAPWNADNAKIHYNHV